MIKRVDSKTQYEYRYRGNYKNWSDSGAHSQTKFDNNLNTTKPLQGGAYAQISFKGFDLSNVKNTLKPITKKIPRRLTNKVFESLKNVSEEQYKYYLKIREEYVNLIKNSKEFRDRYGFGDEAAKEISSDTLLYRPKQNPVGRFLSNIVSPFVYVGKGIKKLFTNKHSPEMEKFKHHEKVMNEFEGLEGLIKSHEIWENGYRKMSGHTKWSDSSEFLIPEDVLSSKIQRRRNKVVDPDKGKYSTTSLMLGNRFISGMVYAYFLGNDAYNTTMRYSNDKNEASGQRNSRVAQEFSRIGLNMYIQNLLFGTFATAVNKSLPTALFVSGSTVAFSEILGRKLVGKPIVPSDKETLDRLEKEMDEKKGVMPAIGRLLTRTKKPTQADVNKTEASYEKKLTPGAFTRFSEKDKVKNPHSANLSFKGYYSVSKMFEKKRLAELLKMIEVSDKKQYETVKENIVRFVKKSEMLKELTGSNQTINAQDVQKLNFIKNMDISDKNQVNQAFDAIMNTEALKEVPFGSKKTFWGQVTKSILVPVTFIKNLGKSIKNSVVNLYRRFAGTQSSVKVEKMNKLLGSSSFKEAEGFKRFYDQRLELKAWKESGLLPQEKKLRIFEEYMSELSKQSEEVEGIKNILLWLDKQVVKAGIKVKSDGTLSPEDVVKVKELMKSSVLKADSAQHVEYDGNKLSQTNINLARAITTLFLVIDAYNLTMQYSNDNKKDANKSAKNRAAQEISRIGFSAYVLAFVHNLLSKLCNSSLAGAFTLTAMTSVINDSISRKVVGVPLTSKSKEQLEEIDEKNSKSKSPIRKALAYSMGKKPVLANKNSVNNYTGAGLDDLFIKPSIS